MAIIDVTNPGLVNAANEGDGPLSVDQAVTATPTGRNGVLGPTVAGGGAGVATTTNPGLDDVADEAFGLGLPRNVNV